MGNTNNKCKYINFEDVQYTISGKSFILINTLPTDKQSCLIRGTLDITEEERVINKYISTRENIKIIIYGMNSSDINVHKKYSQLIGLGFIDVYIYNGGMFEWLLLQDVYGKDLFKTSSIELEILNYKGNRQLLLSLE
jgi:hypothetical protein